MQRPQGVTAIAVLFLLAAGYLCVLGLIMLVRADLISMTLGAPLIEGLEVAGPFMFLLAAAAWAAIGWGLLRLHRWARWAAMVLLGVGAALLIPAVSVPSANLEWRLLWHGLQIALRVAGAWYLAQSSAVIDAFAPKK